MNFKNFVPVKSSPPQVNEVSSAISDFTTPISQDIFLSGTILQGIELSSSPTKVFHKLGRKPNGWVITRLIGSAIVYEPNDQSITNKHIELEASGSCKVDIRVF